MQNKMLYNGSRCDASALFLGWLSVVDMAGTMREGDALGIGGQVVLGGAWRLWHNMVTNIRKGAIAKVSFL